MPLNAQREAFRVVYSDRFDRAIFGNAFCYNAFAKIENTLTVERVHADGVLAQDLSEDAVRFQRYVMAVSEDDFGVRMNLTCIKPRHPVIHPAR